MQKILHIFLGENQQIIEIEKLLIIAIFSLLSLFISLFFWIIHPQPNFQFVYIFIPHVYLIPIILLALWFPKSGLRLVIIILFLLAVFWICANYYGYYFQPIFILLYTGLDLAIFVVFLLYVKDQRLVEAVISDFLIKTSNLKNYHSNPITFSEQNFDDFISKLGHEDQEVREEAINSLYEISDDRFILPLIAKLRDNSTMVRRAAAKVLGKTNSIKAVRPLIQALRDEERIVRETAAESLGHLGSIAHNDLIAMGTDQDWRVRAGVLIAFRITSYQSSSTLDLVRTCIQDPNLYVRREAIKTLGRIGDHKDLIHFIHALKDPDPGVRSRSVRAILRVGSPSEKYNLLKGCLNDTDGLVRITAEEALKKVNRVYGDK